jgi:hypothetical protein
LRTVRTLPLHDAVRILVDASGDVVATPMID